MSEVFDSTEKRKKMKASFNNITMVTVLSHKTKSPLTASDRHITTTIITTHALINIAFGPESFNSR
jgi:hypothetical protein